MTAVRQPTLPPPQPPEPDDVDDEPLSPEELRQLAENDGTFVRWEDLRAELKL